MPFFSPHTIFLCLGCGRRGLSVLCLHGVPSCGLSQPSYNSLNISMLGASGWSRLPFLRRALCDRGSLQHHLGHRNTDGKGRGLQERRCSPSFLTLPPSTLSVPWDLKGTGRDPRNKGRKGLHWRRLCLILVPGLGSRRAALDPTLSSLPRTYQLYLPGTTCRSLTSWYLLPVLDPISTLCPLL